MLERLFDLKQLIDTPTRVTPTSSSLIDHILASANLKLVNKGVLELSLSDHFPIYAVFNTEKCEHGPRIIRCRNFKNFKQDFFIQQITSQTRISAALPETCPYKRNKS